MEVKKLIKESLEKLQSIIDEVLFVNEEQKNKIKNLVSMQRIIRGINETLFYYKDEKVLFENICDIVTTYDNIKVAFVGFIDDRKDDFKEVYIRGDESLINKLNLSFENKIFEPLKKGEIFVENNYLDNKIKSVATLPIFYDSKIVGVFSLFSDKNIFTDEVNLFLKEVSFDISIGYKNLLNEKRIDELLKKTKRALFDLARTISKMVALRDPLTVNHGENVGKLAVNIGRKLNLDEQRLEYLYLASIVHDVGKISIPVEILNKPAKLSQSEYNLVKLHPQIGSELLKDVDFPIPISKIVLQHHEREDGSGYPNGLKGDEILLESKILAVSEVVHAMSSYKPYRPAYSIDEVLEYIKKESGKSFNKEVVLACLEVFKEGFKFD